MWLALSCLLACVVALWSTRTHYCCMNSAALCRADWRLGGPSQGWVSAVFLGKYQYYLLALRTDKEAAFKEDKKKHKILLQWFSATCGLLFHARLLALLHFGRHERTIVWTLLLCGGPIEGCSLVLAVRRHFGFRSLVCACVVCAEEKKTKKAKNFGKVLFPNKESKELREGSFPQQRKQRTSGTSFSPTTNFLVGNYGLRRVEANNYRSRKQKTKQVIPSWCWNLHKALASLVLFNSNGKNVIFAYSTCLLYTSPSPRD